MLITARTSSLIVTAHLSRGDAALLFGKTVSFDTTNHRCYAEPKLKVAGQLVLVVECWIAIII